MEKNVNPKFKNKKLYIKVFNEVNKIFRGRPSAYRSAAVVREYVKQGGLLDKSKSSGGLERWLYRENWKNLTPFSEGLAGKKDFACGKKHPKQKGPSVCRPEKDLNKYTKKQIQEAVKIKSKGGVIQWKKL